MTTLLGLALDGYGWHPRAEQHSAGPFTGRYWTEQVQLAERGLLDFVTFEDSFARTPAGRLDAILTAARVAPATTHIGLIPTAPATHNEPFHISKSIATLDIVSGGRAGWQVTIADTEDEAAVFGRTKVLPLPDLLDEAADAVEVTRRLWDSWEDDAEIRDVATGRFVDRDKLHYIDFEGRFFSVKGPSITPRSPQGQSVVAALARSRPGQAFAAKNADLVFVTPHDGASAAEIPVRLHNTAGHRAIKVLADLVVSFRRDDEFRSDAAIFTGSAAELADLIAQWREWGIDGVRLRPAVNALDIPVVVDELVPLLQAHHGFRAEYGNGTLRERLGLPTATNRYARKSA
ncbi:LLM class flavin-dependent oxidoreductase [Mycobacterium sp. CBMA271]|uniref:LLM class flavin-dependent oxidoreductase n=1 Tax=unclassified Mycobacteroides TaxID=2618759 RepID=UPI001323EF76|nr:MULTISPECIES: LLM class flavin-dependent oxidoreductase [unclassified Mycobacteroides]MUM15396.1 FMNH2-dependent monooxygenase [Mycobacteroides sp. CBMA 326]MUM21297.1 LLM class flavin-dependent oxidoreductase [Mycobacteroides sp. CBMA 271]